MGLERADLFQEPLDFSCTVQFVLIKEGGGVCVDPIGRMAKGFHGLLEVRGKKSEGRCQRFGRGFRKAYLVLSYTCFSLVGLADGDSEPKVERVIAPGQPVNTALPASAEQPASFERKGQGEDEVCIPAPELIVHTGIQKEQLQPSQEANPAVYFFTVDFFDVSFSGNTDPQQGTHQVTIQAPEDLSAQIGAVIIAVDYKHGSREKLIS
jgi:hypothetical protein